MKLHRILTVVVALLWANNPLASSRPQVIVECLGEHALCNATTDCTLVGDGSALCSCWKVNEIHIVETLKIQDQALKQRTRNRCTKDHPCKAGAAPVCRAIRTGQYTVKRVAYPTASTFSYRGWCETFKPVACDGLWADCMGAPCTSDPDHPDRPYKCQCRVESGPFTGINGGCTTASGQIMSTFKQNLWDFDKGVYALPFPGNDYVNRGACKPLASDP